jgi:23S rRNA pseudouridine2605 synthase
MRLQKFLANAGIASRRKAEQLILSGKIKVNGQIINQLGAQIDENRDQIQYLGRPVKIKSEKIYIALNKPAGYIASASDRQGKTVLSLVKAKERIYPVGRLDKDSAGLLILTNDGEFANLLTHPRHGGQKEYFAVLDRSLEPTDVKRLEHGIFLDGKRLKPVKIVYLGHKTVQLILREGVNRQIRRMFGHLGYTVLKLKRVRIGKLELGNLKEGKSLRIRKEDVV